MNDVQNIIDRQLGFHSRFSYDNVLKRLTVHSDEAFYGLQNTTVAADFDQDPPIFACRFAEASGYEHILALANEDGRVAIQDTSTAKTASKLESFQCHNNAVFDLAWMPKNMKFVTVSGDHTASLWDAADGAPRRALQCAGHTRSVKTVAFRPTDPAAFATGARDGRVLLWDARAAAPALALRPDLCLAACHAAPAPPGPRARRRPPRRALSVTGLAFRDDLALVSCGECDGTIKVWDMRKNYCAHGREPLPVHSIPYCGSSTRNGYTNLIVDDARIRLYASCMDDVIYCFNVSTFGTTPERRYVGHENGTFYIKTGLSPDGVYLVSGSSDKNAYVWNVASPWPVVRLTGHRAEVTCAAWGPRGATSLVTCSDDARHMVWRVGREPGARAASPGREPCGRAEPPPRTAAPQWGTDRTPAQPRRAPVAPPRSPRIKRCLAELMGAEPAPKRARADTPADSDAAPRKRRRSERASCDELAYFTPRAGPSDATPPRNPSSGREPLSPRSPNALSLADAGHRTPVKTSPCKVRIISFTTPTRDLPNFVLTGEAPHLRLMSPIRKKPDTTDWLTLLVREKRGRFGEANERRNSPTPSSPKENVHARRNSTTEKTPKSNKKNKSILKYFSVTKKDS